MEPIDELNKTLRSLQKIFKFFLRDIFESKYQYGFRFYVFFAFATFELICAASTIFDSQRDKILRLTVAGIALGGIQVNGQHFYILIIFIGILFITALNLPKIYSHFLAIL